MFLQEAQCQLDSCISDNGDVDSARLIHICDPDMTLTYTHNKHTGSCVDLALLKQQLQIAVQKTEDKYSEIVNECHNGLAPAVQLRSFDDLHPLEQGGCLRRDVDNPKQPDMPLAQLMLICHQQAPTLGHIAAAATQAGGGHARQASVDIKTPLSLQRKLHSTDNPEMPCDLLRASAVCKDGAGLAAAYEVVEREVANLGGCVRTLENYFAEPIGGYMDICLQIELPSEPRGFICELQLQLEAMKSYKDNFAHHTYAWKRLIQATHKYTKDTYIGEYTKNTIRCRGTLTAVNWTDTTIDGDGEYFSCKNGSRYTGQWRDGKKNGAGEYFHADGCRYKGQFQGDKYHGDGEFFHVGGAHEKGQWHNGKLHGDGQGFYGDGNRYKGQFRDGHYHGHGEYSWLGQSPVGRYTGQWQDGRFHGKGEFTKGGLVMQGLYQHGKRTTLVSSNMDTAGQLFFRQRWVKFVVALAVAICVWRLYVLQFGQETEEGAFACHEAYTPDYPLCSGYPAGGFTCIESYCARMGSASACTAYDGDGECYFGNLSPSCSQTFAGRIVNSTTGRCATRI
jgi:hypothetical protein